jgi:hypothetical protein
MPMAWSIRNFVLSGIVSALQDLGITTVAAIRKIPKQPLDAGCVNLSFVEMLTPRLRTRVPGLETARWMRHLGFCSARGILAYKKRMAGLKAPGYAPISGFWNSTGFLLRPRWARTLLSRVESAATVVASDFSRIARQLDEIQPALVVSTVLVDTAEHPYVRIARKKGIATATILLSFDNLTSRSELPVVDHYCLWNERMKRDLLGMYPNVGESSVRLTGAPQFDFHRRAECMWDRQRTLGELGLPADAGYLLYAANVEYWTPTEPLLIQDVRRRMDASPQLRDLWIVVRPHPLDRRDRWLVGGALPSRTILSFPTRQPPEDDHWSVPVMYDQALFVSSLKHAVACANMCSTTSLDAAIHDCPIVGVAFAAVAGSAEEQLYRAAYESEHYAPLVASGAIPLASTPDEFIELLERARRAPEELAESRKLLVARECGVVDGRASSRIVQTIASLLQRGGCPEDVLGAPHEMGTAHNS